jgi:hypothetical protein
MIRQTIGIGVLALLLPLCSYAGDFEQSIDAEPGGTLRVKLGFGSVEVETHDRNEVRVDAEAEGRARSMRFRLSGDGRDTKLEGDTEGGWWFLGRPDVEVRVRIPREYSVQIETGGGTIQVEDVRGSVVARTSGGEIELNGAEGSVDLRTSGGAIDAEEIRGELRARTSGGPISVSEADGPVEVRTSGGDLEILDVVGPVNAHTSGGSVSVRFTGVPEGTVKTSGGSIEAEFAEDAGVDLDARTSGGRVEIEEEIRVSGRIDPSRVEGEINGGGPHLKLRTSGGNILIRAR